MVAHSQVTALLRANRAVDVVDAPDREHSVSGRVVRAVLDGRRTAAVASDAPVEVVVGALLDLLDLHLHAAPVGSVHDEVRLVVGQSAPAEALAALGTLVAALHGGPRVVLSELTGDGGLRDLEPVAADVSAAGAAWADLLDRVAPHPPDLLRRLQRMVGRDDLRAYPLLTAAPEWSLRLEGLEVGRFRPGSGRLSVGRDGVTGTRGEARRVWVETTGTTEPVRVGDDHASTGAAVLALTAFAERWLGSGSARQDEHALESRVLRGVCPVVVPSGPLEVLRADALVSWGSQFPTRWSADGRARHLDALMRRGDEPWVVEMKVSGGAGVGGYYRHAVGQAALYRHFVRSTPALAPWFTAQGLDQARCRAAVLVPDLGAATAWRDRLVAVASLFDVEVAEVDESHARLRAVVPGPRRADGAVPQPV